MPQEQEQVQEEEQVRRQGQEREQGKEREQEQEREREQAQGQEHEEQHQREREEGHQHEQRQQDQAQEQEQAQEQMREAHAAMIMYDYLSTRPDGPLLAAPLAARFPNAARVATEYAAQYISERARVQEVFRSGQPVFQRAGGTRNNTGNDTGNGNRPNVIRGGGQQHLVVRSIGFRGVARVMAGLGFLWGVVAAMICVYTIVLMFIMGETPPGDLMAPVYEKLTDSLRLAGYNIEELRALDRVVVSRVIGVTAGFCFVICPVLYSLVFTALGCIFVGAVNVLLRISGGFRVYVRQE